MCSSAARLDVHARKLALCSIAAWLGKGERQGGSRWPLRGVLEPAAPTLVSGVGTGKRPSRRSSCVRFLGSSLAITDSTQERLYAKPPISRIPQAGPSAMGPAASPHSRPAARFIAYNRVLCAVGCSPCHATCLPPPRRRSPPLAAGVAPSLAHCRCHLPATRKNDHAALSPTPRPSRCLPLPTPRGFALRGRDPPPRSSNTPQSLSGSLPTVPATALRWPGPSLIAFTRAPGPHTANSGQSSRLRAHRRWRCHPSALRVSGDSEEDLFAGKGSRCSSTLPTFCL